MGHQPDDNSQVDLSRVHLVGIGGSGMSGLAHILLSRGAVVTGSDVKDSQAVRDLRDRGALIATGHKAENLELSSTLPTAVVISYAAISPDNPELVRAQESGIAVIRRSDLLGELMEGYQQILLAGTHGKTSTTSMAVVALRAAGLDPSFSIGGQLNLAGTNAHHGSADTFVAEADESDASLLRYKPDIGVITNIEPDHMDFFDSEESYYRVFDEFANRIQPGGHLVVCLDDDEAAACGERAQARGVNVYGYGSAQAAQRHSKIKAGAVIGSEGVKDSDKTTVVELHLEGVTTTVSYSLLVPGRHMVLNSAAALVAGTLAGADPALLAQGLGGFTGVRRRFELKGAVTSGEYEQVSVYDDYAHHPTEVTAVLTSARDKVEAEAMGARVVVCFQPHLYSRTIRFAQEFAQALSLADVVVVLDIFGARESPIEGVDSRLITDKMNSAETEVCYEPRFNQAAATIKSLARRGDIIITMGAGTVTLLADEILSALEQD